MVSRLGLAATILCFVAITGRAQDAKPTPEAIRVLAPTGRLRVGLYVGNPASLLKEPAAGDARGVGFELGREFAKWLGVPFEPVVYPNNGAVLEGMRAGQIDVVFTNATAARAKEIDFAPAAVEVEAGFLVPSGSPIASIADVDRQGIRVGVMEGSTSSTILPGILKSASIVRVPNIETVTRMLSSRALDAFATNKSILYEVSDTLPGSTVLDGRYGVEQLALGIPKGRELGLPHARTFIAAAVSGGLVKAAIARAGLRGGTVKIGV